MKKKDGFIAISLIYSFFLVFLALLLSIAMDYSQNRILLNDVKKETQEYLDGLAEFNPIFIENRLYNVGEEITYAYETWQVLENTEETIKVILNRILTLDEIERAFSQILRAKENSSELEWLYNKILESSTYFDGRIQMCLNFSDEEGEISSIQTSYCGYGSNLNYRFYNYGNSIVQDVLNAWYSDNSTLKKAESVGYLEAMDFEDGLTDYAGDSYFYEQRYIRIPLINEATIIGKDEAIKGEESFWYVEGEVEPYYKSDGSENIDGGKSYIKTENGRGLATDYRGIRPIIVIKKSLD